MDVTKVVLLGADYIGKTSLINRYCDPIFNEVTSITIGIDFRVKFINIDGNTFKSQIWDTGGSERFDTISKMYFRGCSVFIVLYDITRESTFNKAKYWVKEIQKDGLPGAVIAIAGNKLDLEEKREVSKEEVKRYADSIESIFVEVSAKTGENINFLFEEAYTAKVTWDIHENVHALATLDHMNKTLKLYISANPSQINVQDKEGFTPLHIATKKCNKLNLNILLLHGADMSIRTHHGETVFHLAVKTGKYSLLKQLFDNDQTGAFKIMDVDGRSPLTIAVQQTNVSLVALLLKFDSVVNYRDYHNMTPFLYAYGQRSMEIMKLLLGVNPEISNDFFNDGNTVMIKALIDCEPEILDLVLDYSPDLSIRNDEDEDIFDVINNKDIKISSSLLERMKDLNVANEGKTRRTTKIPKDFGEITTINSSQLSTSIETYNVMISYNWDNQSIALQLQNFLNAEEITTWMDVTNMVGNMNKRMAEGVTNSQLFIACLSKKYEDSKNCNKEIGHADYLNRKIIPVIVEKEYKPNPKKQVAILIANTIYYNLADNFEQEFQKLLETIKKYLRFTT